jgi:hypothetical protein
VGVRPLEWRDRCRAVSRLPNGRYCATVAEPGDFTVDAGRPRACTSRTSTTSTLTSPPIPGGLEDSGGLWRPPPTLGWVCERGSRSPPPDRLPHLHAATAYSAGRRARGARVQVPLRHIGDKCVNTQLSVGGVSGALMVGVSVSSVCGLLLQVGLVLSCRCCFLTHTHHGTGGGRSIPRETHGRSNPRAVCGGCIVAGRGVGECNLFGQVSGQVSSMTSQEISAARSSVSATNNAKWG